LQGPKGPEKVQSRFQKCALAHSRLILKAALIYYAIIIEALSKSEVLEDDLKSMMGK
jgi:hypothetical protein